MQNFDESRFRKQVDSALSKIKTILENTRDPQYPSDIQHQYQDKYSLAELLTNTTLAAQLNCLEVLGVTEKTITKLIQWAKTRSVTIRLKSEERCTFDKEVTRKVESPTEHVTTFSGLGSIFKRTDKVVTKITEWFWDFEVEYELFIFRGNKPDKKITLQGRTGKCQIITTTDATPKPKVTVVPSIDLNITYLLQQIGENMSQLKFSIKRSEKSCHTPRRNDQVDEAMEYCRRFHNWTTQVYNYFYSGLFPLQSNHGLDLSSINDGSLFNPVIPLFDETVGKERGESKTSVKSKDKEEKKGSIIPVISPGSNSDGVAAPAKSVILSSKDCNQFLVEQKRSFTEKWSELKKTFTDTAKLITFAETQLLVVMLHAKSICQYHSDGVDYIEDMIRKQLIAAIGKEVGAVDFMNYMRFHNRKLYKSQYEFRPFSFAIRRPDHPPEGVITIEGQLHDGTLAEPIYTTVRNVTPVTPMRFALDAATHVTFTGERYLHAWVGHSFEGQSGIDLNLIARARQFSSFLMMVGTIASAELFLPKAAIIIQNKDDLKIPLMLEQLPTPKEFRDAIESLSPEQQRFAKAFRAMQLEGSLFAICVVQLKPQMEKLLNLPNESLTKEIKLTQELLELFIKYQIPSDLLSFDGEKNASVGTKIQTVKSYVGNMYSMINKAKQEELEEARKKAEFAALEALRKQQAEEQILYSRNQLLDEMIVEEKKMVVKEYKQKKGKAAPMKKMAEKSRAAPPRSMANESAAPMMMADMKPSVAAASTPVVNTPAPVVPSDAPKSEPSEKAPEQPKEKGIVSNEVSGDSEIVEALDYTKIPAELDSQFEVLDEDSALRPTTISTGLTWQKKFQKALLANPEIISLTTTEQGNERNQAYDLLDALSRSGALSIEYASLHVLIAATHCFDKSLMNTVIQDNVNPIEKVERSSLIVSSVIQGKSAKELIKHDQLERVGTYSPQLFAPEDRPVLPNSAPKLALDSVAANQSGLESSSSSSSLKSDISGKEKEKVKEEPLTPK